MSTLAGKAALVTGGGSGIGMATARLLLAEGAAVAITGRNEAKLRDAAAALSGGDRLIWHAADLTDAAAVQRLVEDVTVRLGRIDILVNNAGMNVKQRLFRELTPQKWRSWSPATSTALFTARTRCCRRCAAKSRADHQRQLDLGRACQPAGGHRLHRREVRAAGLALGVAAEEKDNGIRVSSIYPGEVNTPILEVRPEPVSDERKAAMLQPEDVAAAVRFIATLPAHVAIPELIITPANATYI